MPRPPFLLPTLIVAALLLGPMPAIAVLDLDPLAPRVAPAFAAPPPLALIRTLAYHQITHWTTGPNDRGEEAPILSDDGQRIAFARAPGTTDPANPNRIFVINADGSGEQEVDAYPSLCGCGSKIDISGDGSRIVSSDSLQLRVAETNGSAGRELLSLGSGELDAVRISGDGSTIVFRIYRDTTIRNTSPVQPLERGVYAINVDGSGLRQLAGPTQIAPLLGVAPEQAPLFGGSSGLDASTNGAQIVFAMSIAPAAGGEGQGLFAINGDGTGLHKLLGRVSFVTANAISGDGTQVAYVTVDFASGLQEAGVLGFHGGGQRTLTDSTTLHPGTGFNLPSGERIQLSQDGSRLLLGSTGLLYDTTTDAVLALGIGTPWFTTDPIPLVSDGLYLATMNAAATRFVSLFQPSPEPYQLVRLDLNPADLGSAPSVTDPSLTPDYLLTEGRSTATVSARVSTTDPIVRVSSRVLRQGLPDDTIATAPLLDDGTTAGDATANDGLFTNNALATNCCAEVGPRTVRIKAETKAPDGLRHATAVDVEPFAVVAEAPPDVPPTATAGAVGTTSPVPTATPEVGSTVAPTTPTPSSPPTAPPAVTVTPSVSPTVPPEACGSVSFPLGDVSFADAVIAYEPVVTADALPPENVRDPQQALGPPNFVAGTDFAGQAVTLGGGGRLTLQFLDNAIIGDGTAEPDLWVFEVGSEVEETFIEVSLDGTTWVSVGKLSGGTCGVNLDAFGIGPDDRFSFVRLTDDPNEGDPPDASSNPTPGADIDAVGAISTVRVPTPTPAPTASPTPPPPTAMPQPSATVSPAVTPTPSPPTSPVPPTTPPGATATAGITPTPGAPVTPGPVTPGPVTPGMTPTPGGVVPVTATPGGIVMVTVTPAPSATAPPATTSTPAPPVTPSPGATTTSGMPVTPGPPTPTPATVPVTATPGGIVLVTVTPLPTTPAPPTPVPGATVPPAPTATPLAVPVTATPGGVVMATVTPPPGATAVPPGSTVVPGTTPTPVMVPVTATPGGIVLVTVTPAPNPTALPGMTLTPGIGTQCDCVAQATQIALQATRIASQATQIAQLEGTPPAIPTVTPTPVASPTPHAQVATIRVVAGGAAPPLAADAAVELILDTSGSMLQDVDGTPRIDIAKTALSDLVQNQLPNRTPLALRVFGREPGSCETALVAPLQPLDRDEMEDRIAGIAVVDEVRTPIGAALAQVAEDLAGATGTKLVVLVTDGEETCGGDPAAAIQALTDRGIAIRVNIVGFALTDEALKARFQDWARIGGGQYFDASGAADLGTALAQALQPAFRVLNGDGGEVARGVVGGVPVAVPAGTYTVAVDSAPPQTFRAVAVAGGESRELRLAE